MNNQLQMLMVCLTKTGVSCEEDGYLAELGNATHLYCCEDGFKQSLEDFSEHYANRYECHICNDTGVFKDATCQCLIGRTNL